MAGGGEVGWAGRCQHRRRTVVVDQRGNHRPSILYEVAADFGVALLRACIHETQDREESLTALSGVSLIWLAMVEDRFDLASEMALLGAPLHSSPNLLYSDLTAPAFNRVA